MHYPNGYRQKCHFLLHSLESVAHHLMTCNMYNSHVLNVYSGIVASPIISSENEEGTVSNIPHFTAVRTWD